MVPKEKCMKNYPLCIDCKYYKKEKYFANCFHPKNIKKYFVGGEEIPMKSPYFLREIGNNSIDWLLFLFDNFCCNKKGKGFKSKKI